MERGSALRYVNCDLLQYEFPDNNRVYGTVHGITNSTFGMRSCRVRQATPSVRLHVFPEYCVTCIMITLALELMYAAVRT